MLNIEWVRFSGIGVFSEHVVPSAAVLSAALGLTSIPLRGVFSSSNNKLQMKAVLRTAKFTRTAPHTIIRNLTKDTLRHALKDTGIPAVIKPVFDSLSQGVQKIESANDIHLSKVIANIRRGTKPSVDAVYKNFEEIFVVEKFFTGPMFSIDGIVQGGIVHIAGAVELLLAASSFVQVGNVFPPRIPPSVIDMAQTSCRQAIEILGLDQCAFHAEFRSSKEGPILIEIAARAPGGQIRKGYDKASGINWVAQLVTYGSDLRSGLYTNTNDSCCKKGCILIR